MRIRILKELSELEALAGAWLELLGRCPEATPFQSPDWLLPWYREFGFEQSRSLFTIGVFDQDVLRGLAPLMIETNDDEKRILKFIGSGNTDYLDLLVEPAFTETVLAEIFEVLRQSSMSWDQADFEELRPGSPLLALAEQNPECSLSVSEHCPVVPLAPSFERMRDVWSPGLFTKVLKYRRRLEREGAVRYRRAAAPDFDLSFDALVRLHQAQWQPSDRVVASDAGIFHSPQAIAFYRGVGRRFVEREVLRLYLLELNGTPLSAILSFVLHGRAFNYISGFDPLFSNLSPGTLIIAWAMERAIDESIQQFDFLRGQEAYKYRWGAQDRKNSRIRIESEAMRLSSPKTSPVFSARPSRA